jgi:tocopherol O-methyltransferase
MRPAISTGPKTLEANVCGHYDALDAFYREVWGEHLHHGLWLTGRETPEQAARQMTARVALLARLQEGHAVCDVGSGYGATARYLAEERGARVTALTLSERQHAYARRQRVAEGAPRPTYLRRDWLENDLPAASFDAVVAIECASHMADRRRFFAEAFRVLRPGGRLVACLWCSAETPAHWQRRLLLGPIVRTGHLAGLDPPSAYRRWCAEAAFTVESLEDLSRAVRRTWSVCTRRLARKVLSDGRYRRFLFDPGQRHRSFALAVPLLWLAYQTGAMCYVMLTARKPSE